MKFTLDVTLNEYADPIEVADAILDYLCHDDSILDVISYNGVDPMRRAPDRTVLNQPTKEI